MSEKLKPLISVILPTYNRAHFLLQAYDSIVAQSYVPVEVIIVDDGSVDDTAEVVAGIRADNIRYIRQDNSGPSRARNTGIMNSRGEYLAFLDSDDVWLPGKLRSQIDVLEINKTVGMVASAYNYCNEKLDIIRPMVSEVTDGKKIRKMLPVRNFLTTPTIVVRRECLDTVGGFDESLRFAEDWDLWIRIAQKFDVYYIKKPLVNVRHHKISLSSSNTDYNDSTWLTLNRKYCTGPLQRLQADSWRSLNKAFYYDARNIAGKEIQYLVRSILLWPCWLSYRYLLLGNKLTRYLVMKKVP